MKLFKLYIFIAFLGVMGSMAPKPTTDLLKQLRFLMEDTQYVPEPITAYVVPSSDAHNSEYLAECDQFRAFITGFTGSAGIAVITDKKALLWTDGRYYLQAGKQMDENWTLMKEGLPNTPSQGEWLSKNLQRGSVVGVDPKLLSYNKFNTLQRDLESMGHKLIPVPKNLIEVIWKDRPSRSLNPIHPLELNYTGKSIREKLEDVNKEMLEKNVMYLVISALDEIAWFLNIRGSDIAYNPVFFSYLIIGHEYIHFFVDSKQLSKELTKHFEKEFGTNFEIKPYNAIEESLIRLSNNINKYVWFSESSSHFLVNLVPKKNRLITPITPLQLMKAIKNPTEAAGMRKAHIKDAVALCCFFAWLEKQMIKKVKVTEVSAAAKLLEFRKQQKDFVGDSFPTISSFGAHGAVIHYIPSHETDVELKTDQLYLCDSGGQYKDGTTDVTRTVHFGTPTEFERECYTRVLKGQLKLASTIFPNKLKGNFLDGFARQFLWEVGLDYLHGTGHGIGFYLNVHEGPMGIHWRNVPTDPGLQAGMFLSNEPGYYQDGKFGMRIEDIVQIIEAETPHNINNRGFLTFDTITLVPKSLKLIKRSMLTEAEVKQLNEYHHKCRVVIGQILEEQGLLEASDWLRRETEPI